MDTGTNAVFGPPGASKLCLCEYTVLGTFAVRVWVHVIFVAH